MIYRDKKETEEFQAYQIRQRMANRIQNCDNIRFIYKYILDGGGKVEWCKYDENTNSWAILIKHKLFPEEDMIYSILMLMGMI